MTAAGWLRTLAVVLGALWWGGPPAAGATTRKVILPPGLSRPQALWSDGQGQLFIAKGDALFVCGRGVPPKEHRLLGYHHGSRPAMVGSGQGDTAVVVLWDQRGHGYRYQGGAVTSVQLPVAAEEARCLGAVDAAGTFACADAQGGLVLWDDAAVLRSYAPPRPGLTLTALTAGPAGTFYMVDERGDVLEFRHGRYRVHRFPALWTPPAKGQSGLGLWYSTARGRLWLATDRRLVELDLTRGARRVVRIPFSEKKTADPLRAQSLRGIHGAGADFLWLEAEKRVYVFDGRRFYSFYPEQPELMLRSYADELLFGTALDPAQATLFVGQNRGIQARLLETPVLGTGPGEPLEERLERLPLPFINLGMGPRWSLSGSGGGAAFALDLAFGLNLQWRKDREMTTAGLWISPQLGYSYEQDANLFVLGLGAGYGSNLAALVYTPRLVTGVIAGERRVGFRQGLSGRFFYDLVSLELAHQVTPLGGPPQHDVRLMFYLNPGVAAVGAIGAFLLPWFLRELGSAFWRGLGGK